MKISRLIEPLIHSIIWITGIAIVLLYVNSLGHIKRGDENFVLSILYGSFMNILLFYMVSLYLISKYGGSGKWKTLLFYISGLYIVSVIIESLVDYTLFGSYYSSVKESFTEQLLVTSVLNLFILAISLGYGFTRRWIILENQKIALEQENLKSELKYLKSQINPHTLFNLLNMAYSSSMKFGDDITADIIEKISTQLRYMIYECNVESVYLDKEIAHLKDYIDLNRKRVPLDAGLVVNYKIEGDTSGVNIPPLILLPLVENAFKHGLQMDGLSKIDISLVVQKGFLQFIVRNRVDNNKNDNLDRATGIGLDNLKKRLSLLFSEKYKLETFSRDEIYEASLSLNLE